MDTKSGLPPALIMDTEAVAQIILRRPAVANRIQPEDLEVLGSHLATCEENNGLRVLIVAAEGKYFSAGYDIGAMAARTDKKISEIWKSDFETFVDRWEHSPLITIAAIQGPVLGGATDWVLASDFRIGAPSVYAAMPAAKLGVFLYPGLVRRYITRLGLNHAKMIILTAGRVSQAQLQAIGFLNEVVPDELLGGRVTALARQIASLAPLSLRGMKAALNAAADACMDEELVRQTMVETFQSEDFREGVAA
ncbi:MAG: enoyl-CoA hydratase/isomerase family protein, partial [Syntrophales bacterium]|nr:enoyl-CoA hydratase/isomerase family protein [Syntrophales bacterium]